MPRPFFRKAFERCLANNRPRFKHPPYVTERRKTHITMAFHGITLKITACITRIGASIAVGHESERVDLLISFDIVARRSSVGRYFCGLCTEPVAYASRQALWEGHCFEPLPPWVNQELRAEQWLHIHILDSGTSWAVLKPKGPDVMGVPYGDGYKAGAWPVVSDAHGTKYRIAPNVGRHQGQCCFFWFNNVTLTNEPFQIALELVLPPRFRIS